MNCALSGMKVEVSQTTNRLEISNFFYPYALVQRSIFDTEIVRRTQIQGWQVFEVSKASKDSTFDPVLDFRTTTEISPKTPLTVPWKRKSNRSTVKGNSKLIDFPSV
jgi:hypothetical protein